MPALDPWGTVARDPRLSVTTRRLPDGMAGATDDTRRIWLDDRLTETERHCVLAHELVHIKAGHQGHQTPAVEQQVRERAARALIPLEDLLPWRAWQGTLWHLAAEFGVTLAQIAKDFGVHGMTLHKWIRQADIDDGNRPGKACEDSTELRELRRRNRLLEQENVWGRKRWRAREDLRIAIITWIERD